MELVDDAALADVMSQGNGADVKKLPDAGHFVQNEAPDLFNELLLDWLSNQDASSSS
ncbi:MAG: alpha/beta hydrolase [Candidatus Nanopelagicales bacterium]